MSLRQAVIVFEADDQTVAKLTGAIWGQDVIEIKSLEVQEVAEERLELEPVT